MSDARASIAIVGAGSIGVAWAIVFAQAKHSVALHDPDASRLLAAQTEIRSKLAALQGFDLLSEPVEAIFSRLRFSGDFADAVADADFIEECAPEDVSLKRRLFADLERVARPDAILASASSAITASETAGQLATRARCLVVHPGNPPYLLKIAEVAPGPFTSPDVVERTQALLAGAGMKPVLVRREVEGFLFNRLQGAVLREAYCLVRDGVASVADIDAVMTEGLGPRWSIIGPFETSDLNTRGGIAVHAPRMGPAYARMGAERGQNDPWTPDLVADVVAQRRSALPIEDWQKRVDWRDRRLMELARSRKAADAADAREGGA